MFRIWVNSGLANNPNGEVNAGRLLTKMEQFVWCHFFKKGEILVHIQMCDALGCVTHTVALFKRLCVKLFFLQAFVCNYWVIFFCV